MRHSGESPTHRRFFLGRKSPKAAANGIGTGKRRNRLLSTRPLSPTSATTNASTARHTADSSNSTNSTSSGGSENDQEPATSQTHSNALRRTQIIVSNDHNLLDDDDEDDDMSHVSDERGNHAAATQGYGKDQTNHKGLAPSRLETREPDANYDCTSLVHQRVFLCGLQTAPSATLEAKAAAAAAAPAAPPPPPHGNFYLSNALAAAKHPTTGMDSLTETRTSTNQKPSKHREQSHTRAANRKELSIDTAKESIECVFEDDQTPPATDYHKRKSMEDSSLLFSEAHDAAKSDAKIARSTFLQEHQNHNRFDHGAYSPCNCAPIPETFQTATVPTIRNHNNYAPSKNTTSSKCPACFGTFLPPLNAALWPQAPLLLRPTPNSGTIVKGIRFDKNNYDYLWKPGDNCTWWQSLHRHWGKESGSQHKNATMPCCAQCCILPINNGNEKPGEDLVVDFETPLFKGSLTLRIRFVNGTTPEPYNDQVGFFANRALKYVATIRGKFLHSIPLTELTTGVKLNRPCGTLPPKWVIWTGLKVMQFFAPQLKATIEGKNPSTMSPLGSTPRNIIVESDHEAATTLLGRTKHEPTNPNYSILGKVFPIKDDLERTRARRKAFDKLFCAQSKALKTDPNKTYTFEFYQHLFDYQHFSIDVGNALGQVGFRDILDGQPLQIMACHGEQHPLWSFEIWNECLLKDAR